MKFLFDAERALLRQLVFLAIISFLMISIDLRHNHLDRIRSGIMTVIYPVQVLVDLPTRTIHWVASTFVTHRTLRAENHALNEELRLLRLGQQRYDATLRENQRLRRLLGSATQVSQQIRAAELLAVETAATRDFIVLDKGRRHGVYEGQAILDADGVMGQVTEVSAFSSTAMLVTDSQHALPVRIDRTGVRAIARGRQRDDMLELDYIPTNADVQPGDLIVTSGLGGRFPAGYAVGRIVDIDAYPGDAFAKITVEPSAGLSRTREVLLIWAQAAQTRDRETAVMTGDIR